MATPAQLLDQALAKLRSANRVDGNRNSYRKDSPNEYIAVMAYLAGGERPDIVVSDMGVGLMLAEDARRGLVVVEPEPEPEPEPGEGLSWSPPKVGDGGVAVVNFTLTDASKSSSTLSQGAGRDLVIDQTQVITGPMPEIKGWRNVVWIGGEIASTAAGKDGHIILREITGTAHIEGIKYKASAQNDFLVVRWGGANSIIQFQNIYGEVSHYDTSMHTDWFQTQQARIGQLRFDRCTVVIDYQGILLNNETSTNPDTSFKSQVAQTAMRRVNFRRHPANRALKAPWLFYAVPPYPPNDTNDVQLGPMSLVDVYGEFIDNPGGRMYPHSTFKRWNGQEIKYGSFVSADEVRWSTAADKVPTGSMAGQPAGDCRISGVVKRGAPPGGDFCPAGVPGLGYVSPGYA